MIALAAALLAAGAGRALPRTDAPPVVANHIILVGDSTMQVGSGWGGAFCAFHVKGSLACLDLGRGGRSTRSYRAEGSWDIALSEARAKGYRATYVLIQFGHNDESDKSERWTERKTEFPANLRRFILEARAAGAIPVLVTPLTRRDFRNGVLDNTLASWAEEVRMVAVETGTSLVDLNRDSAAAVTRMGPDQAIALAMVPPSPAELAAARAGTTLPSRPAAEVKLPDVPTTPDGPHGQLTRAFDYTHLGAEGARFFAAMVAGELAASVPALREELLP